MKGDFTHIFAFNSKRKIIEIWYDPISKKNWKHFHLQDSIKNAGNIQVSKLVTSFVDSNSVNRILFFSFDSKKDFFFFKSNFSKNIDLLEAKWDLKSKKWTFDQILQDYKFDLSFSKSISLLNFNVYQVPSVPIFSITHSEN